MHLLEFATKSHKSSIFVCMPTIISGESYGDRGHDRTRKTF